MADGIRVNNDELRTTRELMREANPLVDLLEAGELEKVVITRKGKIVAIMLTPDGYGELCGE